MFSRIHIHCTVLTCLSLAAGSALADDSTVPDSTILVTATRFADADTRVPAGVSVITREDIQNTPATNLPDLLKATAGIEVRPLYGAMGIDSTIDLRGFGDTAGSNTLVLLNGQRLNPIDSGPISWSTIPVATIQRIEIIRGAGTVLYGDQASGGVINIITDKSGPAAAFVEGTGGSYAYRGGDAGIQGNLGSTYLNADAHYADTNGWRQNSQADQQSASTRVDQALPLGHVYADVAAYKDSNGLPGALLSNAFQTDPAGASTPHDYQQRDGYRLRPGTSLKLSDTVTLAAEVNAEHENYQANDVAYGSIYTRERTMFSATPRLRWDHDVLGTRNETVAGIDFYDGKADANSVAAFGATPQSAHQISSALYAQNVTGLTERWSLTFGAREQFMNQHASEGTSPLTGPGFDTSAARSRSALDGGLVYQGHGWRAYGKYGSVFRFPNTDELYGFDPFTFFPVFAGNLLPQHGHVGEAGVYVTAGRASGQISLYRLDLNDEIAYDGSTFTNVNLPPTRRQGVEAEFDWAVMAHVRARAAYTLNDAKFREGPNAGHEVPLVARNKGALQLISDFGRFGTYTVALTAVSDRRYSGDFANVDGTLAGYFTADLQARWTIARWTVTARLINALDRIYAPYAGYSSSVNDHYYYPADPRSLFVSVRYQFL